MAFLDNNGVLYLWQKILNKFATKEEIANAGAGDMLKSVYDADNDGKIDNANNAEKLGGQSPEHYAKKTELFSKNYNDLNGIPDEFEPKDHKHAQSDINGLENAISNMAEIAQGKCASYVFETVEELEAWLTNSENTVKLKVGDVFLIKAVNVPDYWWDGSEKQILETTKVNLTAITNAEIDSIIASV